MEIYFPKKAVYQERVYHALNDGLRAQSVRDYLSLNAGDLVNEFTLYPGILAPMQYGHISREENIGEIPRVRERISQYESVFFGWSQYQVDGVFYNEEEDRIDDETTQVIRLLLRFTSSMEEEAVGARCSWVLREILQWVIGRQDRFETRRTLLGTEKDKLLFMGSIGGLSNREVEFIGQHYTTITLEAAKWLDDCALFIFGYLVRNFWQAVLALGAREDEIWVTSFFNLGLNAIKRVRIARP